MNADSISGEIKKKYAVSFVALNKTDGTLVSFYSDLRIKYPKSKKFKKELTISNPFDTNKIGVLRIDIDGLLLVTKSMNDTTEMHGDFQIVIVANQLLEDGFIGIINNGTYIFAMYLDREKYNILRKSITDKTFTKTIIM